MADETEAEIYIEVAKRTDDDYRDSENETEEA